MREVLLRLRHWLIKRLGGYIEQKVQALPVRPPMTSVILHPDRVVASVRVNIRNHIGVSGDKDAEKSLLDMAKVDLAEAIVKKIIEKEYGVITCEPDMMDYTNGRIYSMAVCIVPPDEWMRTSYGNIVDPSVFRDYKF